MLVSNLVLPGLESGVASFSAHGANSYATDIVKKLYIWSLIIEYYYFFIFFLE